MAYSVEKDLANMSKRKKKVAAKGKEKQKVAKKKRTKSPKSKENWVERLKRKTHELLKGDKAYADKKIKKTGKKR